jgi:hypothetical protein
MKERAPRSPWSFPGFMLDQVAAELLSGRDGYQAAQALPGVGRVLGAVIVAEIGDIAGSAIRPGCARGPQANAAAPRVGY